VRSVKMDRKYYRLDGPDGTFIMVPVTKNWYLYKNLRANKCNRWECKNDIDCVYLNAGKILVDFACRAHAEVIDLNSRMCNRSTYRGGWFSCRDGRLSSLVGVDYGVQRLINLLARKKHDYLLRQYKKVHGVLTGFEDAEWKLP